MFSCITILIFFTAHNLLLLTAYVRLTYHVRGVTDTVSYVSRYYELLRVLSVTYRRYSKLQKLLVTPYSLDVTVIIKYCTSVGDVTICR